ncbi:MAG: YDG domain-containing protein [Candidatus Parcubacteria bacterium]|nr:YDG domain-containing protein [Candidatus Parcubacteria bacterium]
MTGKNFFARIIVSFIAFSGILFVPLSHVFAADGSGTNTVSPTNVTVSSTGNNLSFTLTAAETMDSGGFNITVPSGWSAPNSTPATAGYTTVASASGIVATVLNTLDSISGWTANQHMTLSADTGDKQEGTGSLSNAITANAAANEQWYFNYGGATSWGTAANGANGQRVGMWIKSSVNTASGDLSWQDDNSASLASPLDTLAIAALTANTWKYTSVTLGVARTSQLSYGLRYTTDLGAATIKLDSVSILFDAADVTTNWTGDANISISAVGSGQEGTNSIRCTYAGTAGTGANGECYRTSTALTILPGNKVSFWVRSSVALNAGDFAWVDDNSASLFSITDTVSLPALSANTWTYVTLSIPNLGASSIRSYGLRQVNDKGALTIDIDAMGSIINYGDATTGWTAPTSALQTLSLDASVVHEGTGSLKNVLTAGATAGDSWYQTLGATQNWSGYTTVGFWIRSAVAANAGDLQFVYDDASDVSSPIGSINIGALSANTWTYQKLTLTGTRTSVNSFGIKYVTNIGATTINVDDFLVGPGVPTFPGSGVINTRILGLTAPQTMVVSYNNATAPDTTGNSTFTTQTKISDSGTLTNIASSPVVSVDKVTTMTALGTSLTPQTYGTSVTFTATVTPASGGPATGTVTFKDGVTTIGTGTLSAGVATYSTSTLSVAGSPHSITAVYGGDTTFSGSTSSAVAQTMTAKALTVTGMLATTKEYDGGVTATLTDGSLVGVVSGDVITINTRTGTFATKTVGTGKTVDVTSVTLNGSASGNYTVTNPTDVTGTITAKALTVTGMQATTKEYDGGLTATLTGGSLVGIISPDVVSINTRVGTFATKTAGTGKTVNVTSVTLIGADATNYTVTNPTDVIGTITAKALTVTGMLATTKEYDGGVTATLTGGSLVGIISPDVVSINTRVGTFDIKTVGTGKTVNVSSVTLTGTDSSNYTVTAPTDVTGAITAKALTVTGMTATAKEYDGGITATLTGGSLVGVINPDVVSIDTRTGTFATKTVGTGKTVNVSSVTLTGTDSSNYTVTAPIDVTGAITAKALTVTGMLATIKEYDGGTTVTLTNGTLVGIINPDVVSINTRTGTFATKTVGAGKTVNVTSVTLTGGDSSNYTVTNPTDVTGDITAKALTVTGMLATTKEYDGGITATLTGGTLVGVINPDVVSINTRVGTFTTKTVGAGKAVNVSSVTLSGTDPSNYTVTAPTDVTGTITAKALTVTGMLATTKEYDGGITATLTGGSLVGVINPDVVSIDTRTGTFATKTVGTGKAVNVSSVTIAGTDSSNYTVTAPTDVMGTITVKALTVTGMTADSKEYDGGITATVTGGSLVGIISPDVVTLSSTSASFADKFVGNGKTVTVNSITLGGVDKDNYTVTLPTVGIANITPKTLTVTGMTAENKAYDSFTTATVTGGSLVGVISPDIVTLSSTSASFADKAVGNGKTVTVDSITLGGTDKDNYTVTLPTVGTANITAKALTVTGMTAESREYDRGTSATLVGGTLVGVIIPDDVSISSRVGSFADETVGTGKSITVTSVVLGGTDAGNYTVTNPIGITGDITAKALTVTGMLATTKEYDGGITVTLTGGSLVGIISPDTVSIASRSGSFSDKTVGTGKAVNVSSVALSGTDSENYIVTNPLDVVGNVTAKTITVTGVMADDKVYDGNDTAVVNTTSASLVGVILGDIVTINSSVAVGTFDSANVGLDKPVTISGLSLSGTDATNYILTQPTGITASIRNPVPIITNISPSSKDAGDSGFTLMVNGSGFLSNSVVKFNGSSRTTSFVTSAQLTAEILTSDVITATSSALITVTNPAPGGGTSNAQVFTVAHAATQFVIIPPTAGTVDSSVTVTVQAQKANGVIDTDYQDDVTLNTSGTTATGGGLVSITNGEGTLSLSDTVAETVHLTLTDSQSTLLSVTSAQDLVFAPGAVTDFSLNSPGNMNARTRLGFQITRKDQYSNAVLAGTQTAYLYSNSTSTDKKFYDDSLTDNVITSIDFTDGSALANFWYYDDMPGTYTLTASDHTPTADLDVGINDATRDVTVIPVAVKFVILTASSTSVDSPLTITVQAQKENGDVDASFQEDVTLNADGSVTGDGLVNIVNGVGTKNLSNTVAESIHLTLTDSEGAGLNVDSSATVQWLGGATTQFSLTEPTTLSAGSRVGYTISRKDQHGNSTSQDEITAYLYSSSVSPNKKFYDAETAGTPITSITLLSGQQTANFWYYDEAPGTVTITASDGTPTANGAAGISDAVKVLSVTPGPVSSFTLNNAGDMTAKTRLGYTVTRKDQFGNLVTSGNTTAYLYTTAGALGVDNRQFYDSATLGNPISNVSIGDGSSLAHFWYYEEVAGLYTVTASDSISGPDALGVTDGTASVNVSPAPIVATKFVIIPPSSGTVDSPITITIQAQDDMGSLDTTATSSVMLLTSGAATGAGLVTLTDGVGTIQISDHNAETVHLTLSDVQSTGLNVSSTADAIFSTGEAKQLFIDNPGDTAAGARLGFTVTRKDQFGNLITTGVTNVTLDSSSAGVKRFYDAVSGGSVITSVNILEGQSIARFWYYDELAGSATVTVAGTAPGMTGSNRTFAVAPSSISKFTIDNPGNMTAGTRLEYTLTRKDTFDNLVTSGIVSAYLYSSAATTSSKFYDVATGGFLTDLVAFADGSATTNFWYYEEAPGTWVITASDGTPIANGTTGIQDAADSVTVTLAIITATHFTIQPVSNGTINLPTTVTIRAEDVNGNVDANYNHNVTLVTSGSATGGGVVTMVNGVGTMTIRDTVAETITLSLIDSQSTGLGVSSTQTLIFNAVFVPPTIVNIAGIASLPSVSGVRFTGKAFPGAVLNVVAIGGTDSLQAKKGVATSNGNFVLSFSGLTGGARSYGIVGTDKNNNTTQVKIFDANQANALLQLDVNGILLSPTIGLARGAVTKGDVLGITGAGAPGYKIEIQIDNQPTVITATVDSKGVYKALVPTFDLGFGSHMVRTRQVSPAGLKSDYSPQEVFSVVNIFTPNMDFNGDGTIGIQDYSIFVSRWQSANATLKAKDDLNGDGKVNIQDLSIFVKTLKK